MPAEVENMVSGGNVNAWHDVQGIYTVPEEVMTFAQAAQYVPELAMEVRRCPLWAQFDDLGEEGGKLSEHVALVRSDNRIVGVVSPGYQIYQGREMGSFLDDLLQDGSAKIHTAGTLRQGKQVWIQCLAPETVRIAGIPEEEHQRYVSFLNSFDGSTKVKAVAGLTRIVCWNTFNAAMSEAVNSYEFKHTATLASKIAEARAALRIGQTYWEAVVNVAEVAIRTTFSDRQFMQTLDELIPLPSMQVGYDPEEHKRREGNAEREREILKTIWTDSDSLQHCRRTAWAAMNTWSEFTDHHIRSRNTKGEGSAAENRMRRIYLETSLKDRATTMVRDLAGIN